MAKSRDFTATLVGLFLFVGLVILGLLIIQFGKIQRGHVPRYGLNFTFTDATGIIQGCDVRLGGAKIGVVGDTPVLNETFDRVVVHTQINEGIRLPRNAEITIAGAGLLGDKYVSIQVPAGTDPSKVGYLLEGETIEGMSAGSLTSLQMKVEELSVRATNALTDVQGGVTRIVSAVDEFEKVARSVNTSVDKLNNGVLSEDNLADVRASMQNLRKTSENFATASEKLGPALDKGSKAMDNIDATLAEIRAVFQDLKPVTEKVKTSVDRIGDAAISLDKGVRKLTTGDGLLPALINDRDLRDEFHALVTNLRHRGVLFYKDTADKEERPRKETSKPPGPRSMSGR